MSFKKTKISFLVVISAFIFASCGGGGNGLDITIEGRQSSGIDANSIQFSDMQLSFPDGSSERISDVSCTPSGLCQMNVRGQFIEFHVDDTDSSGISANIYNTLGDWKETRAAAIYGRLDGASARYAVAAGIMRPNSLPLSGSATWRGDMAGLDINNRAVRGGAELSITNLSNPFIDVTLTPEARAVMRWENLLVRNNAFLQQNRLFNDYIRGEFYGSRAEEIGGVFERNNIVGAFGAKRE